MRTTQRETRSKPGGRRDSGQLAGSAAGGHQGIDGDLAQERHQTQRSRIAGDEVVLPSQHAKDQKPQRHQMSLLTPHGDLLVCSSLPSTQRGALGLGLIGGLQRRRSGSRPRLASLTVRPAGPRWPSLRICRRANTMLAGLSPPCHSP